LGVVCPGESEPSLGAKYRAVDVLNRNYGTSYGSFSDVPLIVDPPFEGLALSDWAAVISGWKDPDTGKEYRIPADQLRVHSIEFLFRDALQGKYGDIGTLNAKLGTAFGDFMDILPPQRDAHYFSFLDSRGALRREFVTRNYKTVLDYLFFHGRGILNTAIYCSLAVLFALLINPLAAYALSRYRMPSTYKILLFLMMTMAFPPMVTQIPVFLMLRKLHLLNTFAALILPGLANGYSIFLLKGFFDSLPRELYESASIDGASEWTMFWRITMSLSTPILSVIALQAFTAAYANFMYALLICQDEKMWTLMVWLYQLQERSGQAVMYASLLIAAIPTFIIFVLCQKVIMRGIVVPVEK
jgi:ABC-type glycerol-3-phosphate transport system permease component